MKRAWLRLLVCVLPPSILCSWLWFVGSYSWFRDILGLCVITLGFWRLQAGREKKPRSPIDAMRTGLRAMMSPLAAFSWLVACWVTLSTLDVVFREAALPLRGNQIVSMSGRPSIGGLRVGLALSGGGYRAALVHAGVLQELAESKVPVTNIVSVSGGSIIGAFVSRGGDPADFVEAVKSGRFRFNRELLSAFALPRWLLPFGSFSRRDVQASIVRRVLLDGAKPASGPGPALMIATTDLRRGLSIGSTDEGFMVAGPTTARFFRNHDAMVLEGLDDLATNVAASGAFPGAFPALETSAQFTVVGEPLDRSSDVATLPLALADGGVRDNLGLRLLQAIDQEARGTGNNSLSWPGFKPGPQWTLDLIIVSDGGQSFDAAEGQLGPLAQAWRAIELSGLETGILRPLQISPTLPIVALSTASEIGLSPDAVVVQSTTRPSMAIRRDILRAQQLSDETLARLVEIAPSRAEAEQALADYLRTRKAAVNLTDVDERCGNESNRDLPECHWLRLYNTLLEDIYHTVSIFRSSATLKDQFRAEDADALVRLGRYFVALKDSEIRRSLSSAATH